MSRLAEVFSLLRKRGEGAYIPYVCLGDPSRRFSLQLVEALWEEGADIVELGLPFSDPIADGPTIQQAMTRSLDAGFRVNHLFGLLQEIRGRGIEAPMVVMTYFNLIYQMGVQRFCQRLAENGADGLLIVDLPLEESERVEEAVRENSIDLIRLVTPTSTESRLRDVLSVATGFAYLVSVAGTTGSRATLEQSTEELVRRVTSMSRVPVCVGFGISRPEHVRAALGAGAAGVVEGSQLISIYTSSHDSLQGLREHARAMKLATRRYASRPTS